MGIFDSLIGDVKLNHEENHEENHYSNKESLDSQNNNHESKRTYKNGVPVGLYSNKFYEHYGQKQE